jgi:hypothetical protein
MTNIDAQDLASRYTAVWNQPDARLRRNAIEELWAPGGCHILQPPEEIRETAAGLGFDSTTLEAHGYAARPSAVVPRRVAGSKSSSWTKMTASLPTTCSLACDLPVPRPANNSGAPPGEHEVPQQEAGALLTAAWVVVMREQLDHLAVLRMEHLPSRRWRGRLFALLRTAMQATPPLGAGLAALTMPDGATVTVQSIAAVMGLPALVLALTYSAETTTLGRTTTARKQSPLGGQPRLSSRLRPAVVGAGLSR